VIFEVQEVADEDPREEIEAMARWRCLKLPGTAVRSDQRSAVVRA
jgi:hypothetical protein